MDLVKLLLENYGPWALFGVMAFLMWRAHRDAQQQNTEYLQEIIKLLLAMVDAEDVDK